MHWCRLMCIADPFLLRFASKTQCQRITNLYWRRNPAHLQTILYYILDSQFCWQEKNRKTMSNSTPKDIRILRAHEIFVFFLCCSLHKNRVRIIVYCRCRKLQNILSEFWHRKFPSNTISHCFFFSFRFWQQAATVVLRDNKRIFRPKIYIIHSI